MGPVKSGVGGWLLVLCGVLLIWQPISLGLVAARSLDAVFRRGLPLVLLLSARLLTTAFGIAAGLALISRHDYAVGMTKVSLVASAAVDLLVHTTPYFPNNRRPGDTPLFVAAALIYYAVWLVYLSRSGRVRNTFQGATRKPPLTSPPGR